MNIDWKANLEASVRHINEIMKDNGEFVLALIRQFGANDIEEMNPEDYPEFYEILQLVEADLI